MIQDQMISKWLLRLTQLAALLGFIESAFLFGVQWLDLRAFCLWCLVSAVAAIVIAIVVIFDNDKIYVLTRDRELKRYLITFIFSFCFPSLDGGD